MPLKIVSCLIVYLSVTTRVHHYPW